MTEQENELIEKIKAGETASCMNCRYNVANLCLMGKGDDKYYAQEYCNLWEVRTND